MGGTPWPRLWLNRCPLLTECKAFRETLGATFLKNLLGTIYFRNYPEGWLISSGPLGKDAKGFQHEWEQKPVEERQRMTIYTPERVIEALVNSGAIKRAPEEKALEVLDSPDCLGEWTLLITEFGTVWAVACLQSGIPVGVLAFSANTGHLIDDVQHLRNLAGTDSTLRTLDFEYFASPDTQVVGIALNRGSGDFHRGRPRPYRCPARAADDCAGAC